METKELKHFLREAGFKTEDTHTFWELINGDYLIEVMIYNLDTVNIRIFKNIMYNLELESQCDNQGAYELLLPYTNRLTGII